MKKPWFAAIVLFALVLSAAVFARAGQTPPPATNPGAASMGRLSKMLEMEGQVALHNNTSLQELFPNYKVCDLFSPDASAYMVAIRLKEDGSRFSLVIYGRLATGKSFSDLMTAGEAYPSEVAAIADAGLREKVSNAKVLIWAVSMNQSAPHWNFTPLPYVCEEFTDGGAGGVPFRCAHAKGRTFETKGLSRDELIFLEGELPSQPMLMYMAPRPLTGATDEEKIASQCVTFPFTLVNLLYAGKGDADADGIPDAYDAEPNASVTPECDDDDADCDGVADESDLCPGTAFGVAVDQSGCPAPTASTGAVGPAGASGETASCMAVPAAPPNLAGLMIMACALGVLTGARRR